MRSKAILIAVPTAVCAGLPGLSFAQSARFTECAAPIGCIQTFSPAPGYPGNHAQMAGGLTVGDFNNDGWPDLYALGGGNQPDRLFINQQDGTFADETAPWGIDQLVGLHRGVSAAVGDVNGDGFDDLYLVSYGPVASPATNAGNRLLLNQGGSFIDAALDAGVRTFATGTDGMGSVLGDIDNDGDLDLFVCSWFVNTSGNRLFINTGNDANQTPIFIDATAAMGVDLAGVRGFTPHMVDMTGDRLPDLLITADFGTSRFLVNEGLGPDNLPRFRDVTEAAGITADTNGMGATIADADNDGDLDWFITNIFFEFGGATNTLYLNNGFDDTIGAPTFTQQATPAGVQSVGWGWGTVFGDFDNDGDQDLAATGGWFQYPGVPARLYENRGVTDGVPRFADIAQAAGIQFQGLGRSLVTLDFDRDGDLDLAMSVKDSPLRIWRNETPIGGAWIQFDLDTSRHPCLAPRGQHTRIEILAGGSTIVRTLDNGPTYLGQSEMLVHAGLGAIEKIDAVRIEWPDGSTTILHAPAINRRHTVRALHPADFNEDGSLTLDDVPLFLDAFLAGRARADLTGDGVHDLLDLVPFIHALTGQPCKPVDR